MESTKDQARPKLSARSKKTTQIQARSVKRNASDGSLVWMGGADVSLLDFCSIAFYKQRRMEGGTALPDLLSFFYSPLRLCSGQRQPPAHGAHVAHAPGPGMVGRIGMLLRNEEIGALFNT